MVVLTAAWEACAAWAAAGSAVALVHAAGPSPVVLDLAASGQQVTDPAREELALALRTSPNSMGNRISAARDLVSHPRLVALVESAAISAWAARLVILELTRPHDGAGQPGRRSGMHADHRAAGLRTPGLDVCRGGPGGAAGAETTLPRFRSVGTGACVHPPQGAGLPGQERDGGPGRRSRRDRCPSHPSPSVRRSPRGDGRAMTRGRATRSAPTCSSICSLAFRPPLPPEQRVSGCQVRPEVPNPMTPRPAMDPSVEPRTGPQGRPPARHAVPRFARTFR